MLSDRFVGEACPVCGEGVEEAHVRGPGVVLVPCGHEVRSLSVMELPDDVDPGSG